MLMVGTCDGYADVMLMAVDSGHDADDGCDRIDVEFCHVDGSGLC